MEIIPAIDLRGGRCVRLYQGDYDRETVYGEDPAAMALHWQSLGARHLHIVDLDGARSGKQENADAVRAILDAVDVPVQLGGGLRDLATIERWLSLGIARVFLGTAAVESPELVVEACRRFPGHIGAGADARDGRIAVGGWETSAGEPVTDFVRRMIEAGVGVISYTDISRDGTLEGPNLVAVKEVIVSIPNDAKVEFILAGGIGSLDDVMAAAAVPGIDAVIAGRALYENRLDLREALAALTSRS